MRLVVTGFFTIFFSPALAFASDYDVSASGSLSDAIAAANKNTDGDTYEINISGSHGDSGTLTQSTSITGDASASLTGKITFTGSDMASELHNLKFGTGQGSALTNGIMPEGKAQNLTLNAVTFDQRSTNGFGGAIFNIGNMSVHQNSVFQNNKADYGGAMYNAGTGKVLKISDTRFLQNTASSSGGAINNSSTAEISYSVFDANRASYYGGAVYSSGTVRLNETTFSGNKASEGGAVYTTGNKTSLTIDNSKFVGNYTSINSQGFSDFGGAINSVGSLSISNTLFDGNYATGGGAIKLRRGSTDNTIASSEFKNNYAAMGAGGAIAHNDGTLEIDGTKFTNNESKVDDGGAIYTESALNISGNSQFTGNKAAKNGGAVFSSSGAALNVDRVSFSDNHADNGYGGALYSAGSAELRNVSITGNSASLGGGIMNFGNMVIGGNSYFTDNKATAGGAIFTLGTLNLDTTDGNIVFKGNKATDGKEGGADIYLNTSGDVNVNIQGDGNILSMDGGFAGTGFINKTGKNTLIFSENSDNTLFSGSFTQSAGVTEVYADNFFSGTNTVTGGSVLHFARGGNVNNLQLKNNGRLDLRNQENFSANTLTVKDLVSDGSATIALQTDGTTSDLLKITGSATGKIILDINAAGSNPTRQKIEVVNVENADSDAEFKLAGDKVDIGAYEYGLTQDSDTNWYLGTDGTLIPTAKSIEKIPSLHLSIVNAGLNELRKRLGDLRSDNPNVPAGLWVRSYGKQLRIHEKTGARMGILGMEGGFDIVTNLPGGKMYLGILGGYLSSDNIRVFQKNAPDAKGHSHTPVAGIYASWFADKTKWFVDLTARYFQVSSDLNNIRDHNAINGYDLKRDFRTFSAETGRLFDFSAPRFINSGSSLVTIEPKLELRYAQGNSKKFITNNGGTGFVDKTRSLVSRLNIQTSYLPKGERSTWKLFAELGIFNEWLGKTKINFAETALTTSDLGGLGAEVSLGFNAAVSDTSYLYSAMTVEVGKAATSYMFNAGLRVKF